MNWWLAVDLCAWLAVSLCYPCDVLATCAGVCPASHRVTAGTGSSLSRTPWTSLQCCVFSLERTLLLCLFSLSSVTEKHAPLGWEQVTDLTFEENLICLPREAPGLLLRFTLGHYHLALWSTACWFCSILAESEQRVWPCTTSKCPRICWIDLLYLLSHSHQQRWACWCIWDTLLQDVLVESRIHGSVVLKQQNSCRPSHYHHHGRFTKPQTFQFVCVSTVHRILFQNFFGLIKMFFVFFLISSGFHLDTSLHSFFLITESWTLTFRAPCLDKNNSKLNLQTGNPGLPRCARLHSLK